MRQIRYAVAASLDGYIAGPNGEADWIVSDPAVDFAEMFARFDTLLVGRRTFETMARHRRTTIPGMKTIVVSSSLRQQDHPEVTIITENAEHQIASLWSDPGKDIWLFGGGELFRRLLNADLVDAVQIAVMPVLLGGGTPVLATPAKQTKLRLTAHRIYPTGIVSVEYVLGTLGGRPSDG